MQVRYHPTADRVLWQLRTAGGEMFAVWLTRRMLRQLWPPLANLVILAGVARVAPNALVLPEARAMMAQAARDRPLPNTDFATPFDAKPAAQPLGPEPLLPGAIDLGPAKRGPGLALALREPGGRNLSLQLSADLATGLLRLLEQALAEADWGVLALPAAPDGPAAPDTPPGAKPAPVLLN